MFSKRRSAAASQAARNRGPKAVSTTTSASDKAARAQKRAQKRAAKSAAKSASKAASQVKGLVGKADRLAAVRAATAPAVDEVTGKKGASWAEKRADGRAAKRLDKPVYAPGEEPGTFNLAEWSLRRKVALVLAVPVIVAAVFGGLRVNTERGLADNYAASESQVGVLAPAIDYLVAAERAAVVARAFGITDPRLEEAQRAVIETHVKFIEARDRANLTPQQLAQINDVITLSEQLRTGQAYVSVNSSMSQVRSLERGITQIISLIVDEQTKTEPTLLFLAQALDGRLSLALQEIQLANSKTLPELPVVLYAEFGVELGSIDRLAISLGQDRVQEIRQANAMRVEAASKEDASKEGTGKVNIKITDAEYAAYDSLIGDLLNEVDENLASDARKASVLTWVDSIVIGLALLAAIILALLVSRLLLTPIRRVRAGALEVAHVRLPEAVARIRAGEDPGEIEPIGVTTHEETGQLARAVDDLHRQAVKLASGEAELRAQVGDMFVTLSRRNTSLINQQLGLIETLESDEEDPQRLESLFRLDHLASRMRRNAESLVILSGAPTRATEHDDLSLTDLLQAAIAGVQDYRRVQLDAAPAQRVNGEAAADVVHLLSELVDNALSYSPPSARVQVTSSFTRGGVIVQVADGGLGMAEDALLEVNERLRGGGEVNADTARRMGLFVVSRLAERHGLAVQLDQNDRMGVTATVFLPTSVLSDTARLEAGAGGGSGDAQVIELGVSTATQVEEHEEYDVEAEVVAYRRPEPAPEPEPVQELDPIAAAINAYGLPQRRPGASGAGLGDEPVAMAGGFFERVEPDETAAEDDVVDAVLAEEQVAEADLDAVVVDAHEEEERAPIALGPVASDTEEASEETDEMGHVAEVSEEAEFPEEADVEADEVEADEVAAEESEEEVEHVAEAEDHDDADDAEDADEDASEDQDDQDDVDDEADDGAEQLAPVLATLPLNATVAFDAREAAEQVNGTGNGNGLAARLHGLASAARQVSPHQVADDLGDGDVLTASHGAGYGAGYGAGHSPASMREDETPIFRSLRSNWLSSDTGERPWSDSEVDAGWDAADRVEATPPTRRTETGLPMRRPGNRLIPGGLSTPAPAQTVRDPDAIRARLAAHAAGVSRGRNAASVPHHSTQEADPA